MAFGQPTMRAEINREEDNFIKMAVEQLAPAKQEKGEQVQSINEDERLADVDADNLLFEQGQDYIIEQYVELPLPTRNKVVEKLLASNDATEKKVLILINKLASDVEIDKNLKAQLNALDNKSKS